MRWEGTIRASFTADFDVEADTEEAAIEKATYQCARALHDYDEVEVEVDTIYAVDEEEAS